ncbi:MAG TPA: LytTR family DNA-binding domain-containing protein [Thermoanaerobaculia bacterium]
MTRLDRACASVDAVGRMLIRTLIVDDEPLARKRIRALLRDHPDFDVVAEAENGDEALEAVREHDPELVFLDVQMPGLDGFEVVRSLGPEHCPLIVFVTAFEQYALQAFQVSAVQYLLKPIGREEFGRALDRVRKLRGEPEDASTSVTKLLDQLRDRRTFLQRVLVKARGRALLFRIEEIDWFESAGNYIRLHIGTDGYLLRETMSGLEEKLDPQRFVRVHRTAIVNVDRIRELQAASHGDYMVVLKTGAQITLSRVYRDRLDTLLGRL